MSEETAAGRVVTPTDGTIKATKPAPQRTADEQVPVAIVIAVPLTYGRDWITDWWQDSDGAIYRGRGPFERRPTRIVARKLAALRGRVIGA